MTSRALATAVASEREVTMATRCVFNKIYIKYMLLYMRLRLSHLGDAINARSTVILFFSVVVFVVIVGCICILYVLPSR